MQTTSLGCTGMKEYKKKPVKLSKKLLEAGAAAGAGGITFM